MYIAMKIVPVHLNARMQALHESLEKHSSAFNIIYTGTQTNTYRLLFSVTSLA